VNGCICNPGEADRQLKMADEVKDFRKYLEEKNKEIVEQAIAFTFLDVALTATAFIFPPAAPAAFF